MTAVDKKGDIIGCAECNQIRAAARCVNVTCNLESGLRSRKAVKNRLREQNPEIATSKPIIRQLCHRSRLDISPQRDPTTIPTALLTADPDPHPPSLRRPRPAPTNAHPKPAAPIARAGSRQIPTAIPCSGHCASGPDVCVGVSWCRLARAVVGWFATPLGTRRVLGTA
jgi:hypothetical protein